MNSINAIDLDFSRKLEVAIKNEKPLILADLTMALLGVAQQFENFIEKQAPEEIGAESALFIKEVRSGSIVVELVAQSLPVIPLLWQGGSLSEWVEHAKSIVEWLNGKISSPPKDIAKQDLRQWNNILEPIAKDHGSQLNFTVSDGGKVINQFYISSGQANAAQNSIRRELGRLDEPDDHVQRKRVMVWYQTKFDESSQTGNKAVIESITRMPVKVIFENAAVKKAMLSGDQRFPKPWHELAYIVDVRVQTVHGVPKVYTIINYYDEDTFDPSE